MADISPVMSTNLVLNEFTKGSHSMRKGCHHAVTPFSHRMALSLSKGLRLPFPILRSGTMPAWFYILRLRSGALYPGATKNLEERYEAHLAGNACRTTQLDPPVALLYSEPFPTFSEARKREMQIKRWTRAKKEALVAGDLTKLRSLAKSRKKPAQ